MMSFRSFLLIFCVFLSVLKLCFVEDPQAQPNAKPSSQFLSEPPNDDKDNVVISNGEQKQEKSSEASPNSPSSLTSSSLTLSSSSSSISESASEISSSSSDLGISTSELEQLVLPTVAPATPQFDTETVTSSLSVVTSITEAVSQEKLDKEESNSIPVLVSTFEAKDLKNEEPIAAEQNVTVEKQEEFIDKQEKKEEAVPESVQENKGEDKLPVTPPETEEKKIEEKKEEKTETIVSPPTEDKDDDSITAGLKQAEQETKPTSEEMPSFDEFKRQLQQEEEKQKSILKKQQDDVAKPAGTPPKPKPKKIKERKQNNYASMDCGAKLLDANPEASNIFSILQDNRDIYMLNPCTAKIWFIVELCDTAQVRRIDIANFELFSSTPESFKVYVSGRYPTRDWTLLGTFQARDERTLQSFPLEEPIYAKYFKVEMLSHFGKEHYCPLSLFRVYGTSMMEELEDHEEGGQEDSDSLDHDDDLIQILPPDPSDKSEDNPKESNILATVGDTLMKMVKNAAKKLTGVIKDDESNGTNDDSIGLSTVAPTTGIVSSMVLKQQQTKQSIVTLIPSEEEDENVLEQLNKTTDATGTNTTDTKGPDQPGTKPKDGKSNFFGKVDSDSEKGSKSTASFTSCQILVRMLGHSGFGCFMGKVLYSKRKHGITPREDVPKTRQHSSIKDKSVANVDVGKTDAKTEKEKEDSKKTEEEKKDNKKGEKVEEKEKKSEVEKKEQDEKPAEKASEKLKGSDSESIRIADKETIETKYTPDESKEEKKEEIQSTPSVHEKPIDPSLLVQPSQADPSTQPLDSNTKDTPSLSSVSVLTTQPSRETTESTSTNSVSPDSKPTLDQVKKTTDESTSLSKSNVQTDEAKVEDVKITTKEEDVGVKSVESESTTNIVKDVKGVSSSSVEESPLESKGSCTSVQASDHSLVNPTQQEPPTKCAAPTVVPSLKDVDVLEFKLLDSTGREGTAHPEKPVDPEKPDKQVKPEEPEKLDKQVKPDQPEKPDNTSEKEENSKENELKKDEEKEKSASVPEVNEPLGGGTPPDLAKVEESSASSSSSVSEPSKPDVVAVPSTSVIQPEDSPPTPPPVQAPIQDSINPLPAPPLNTDTSSDLTSSIEASLADELGKSSSSAIGQGQGTSGAQKESIFMRLTNRIKALEQNLTLSTLYMEKLNQKYRQIVEEMQKNFDKRIVLLTNATIKAENVIKSQKEQMAHLEAKVDETRKDMDLYNKKLSNLNKEVMERHIIGLFLEVIFIIVLFIVFRRWDKARFRRDILRDSLTNGSLNTSHSLNHYREERSNLSNNLNGQLSAHERLQRSFSTPALLPENVGAINGESVVLRHKEDYYPCIDAKKKRNRRRPKSAILTTHQGATELTNQNSQNSVVSTTAGLLFSPSRGLINGISDSLRFSRSQDDTHIHRKLSTGSNERLSKAKSLNVIHENPERTVFPLSSKKGRIPSPPPPPPSTPNGMGQKRTSGQLPSSIVLTHRKGKGLNGHHPIA